MPEQNIAFRLKLLMENIGMSSTQFADKCDIARPTLSQLLSGRNKKISNLIIEHIHSAFPDISVMWLLFGEGEMWATSVAPANDPDSTTKPNSSTNDLILENAESPENDYATISQQLAENRSADNNNPFENPGFNPTTQDDGKKCKEIGLKQSSDAYVNTINENINSIINRPEILTQITKMAGKPRLVDHITIYYDDSTFETFYPNRH